MAFDPHLADLMRTALHGQRGISEKKMFGGVCWMLNGNMLCGIATGRYMFRVGKEQQEQALARPGATPMDLTGRPMGGLVWVDADAAIDAGLKSWIDMAAQFANSLPPK